MSTSSHVPSSAERRADGLHHLLRVGHVVDAVERGHADRPSGRSGIGDCRGSWNATLRSSGCCQLLLGAVERVLGDVVADERRLRERFGHQQHGAAGAAADVDHRAPGVKRVDDAVERGQHDRQQEGVVPRLEAALDADRTLGAVAVVVVADAGAEALAHVARAPASSAAGGGTCPCRTPGGRVSASTAAASGDSENLRRRRRPRSAWRRPGCRPTRAPSARAGRPARRARRWSAAAPASFIAGTGRAGRRGGSSRRSPRPRAW